MWENCVGQCVVSGNLFRAISAGQLLWRNFSTNCCLSISVEHFCWQSLPSNFCVAIDLRQSLCSNSQGMIAVYPAT